MTGRLLLRSWTDQDEQLLFELSTDPLTMRYFPSLPTRQQVGDLVAAHRAHLAAGRPGLFAVERRSDGRFLGWVGLALQTFEAPFTPAVEIGWRLAPEFWGQGYATEAAREVLRHGFEQLGLTEVVSMTAVVNEPSIAVMRRLGMHRDPADDFEHPRVPEGHPLRPHVLYRLSAQEWRHSQRRGGPPGPTLTG